MGKADCLFCRIIEGNEPSEVIAEDEEFIAIHDKFPKAPVHALVMPRRHLESLNDIGAADGNFCKRMLEFVVAVSEMLEVKEAGYRVITNVGSGGGQIIFHIHWHILAGRSVGFRIEETL